MSNFPSTSPDFNIPDGAVVLEPPSIVLDADCWAETVYAQISDRGIEIVDASADWNFDTELWDRPKKAVVTQLTGNRRDLLRKLDALRERVQEEL